ncbi:geranylgeranyl pyrophosphate synthetase [Diaporthe helianthi]|uniref:Geranylgeranyl pyrophosphate synthetase n=1 Tax=Diaporthe helianthi TaxID=158607 RepID=A0A2P5HSC4_DIAHE|nr:geranylgeranyl pyrophosphate synthetase [Diaporthe helianthi]
MSTPSSPSSSSVFLQSPNPIPPRTSSTGQHTTSPSLLAAAAATTSSPSSRASILRPVPEGDWIGSGTPPHHHHHHRSPPTAGSSSSSSSKRPRYSSLPSTSILAAMSQRPPPPPDPSRYAHDDFNFIGGRKSWAADKDRVIMGPFEYLNEQRGKDFRSQLIAAFNVWLDVPPASIEVITKVVGMLHTASLLIDDVEDNSLLRRGLPVAHALYGVPQTINSANYVYFCALEELQKLQNPTCVTVFADELLNLHRGQGMDLFWRDTLTCPTEDEYLEMVGNKTGGLFRLGIKLMQAESPRASQSQSSSSGPEAAAGARRTPIDCVPLINLIGLIFQIRDDYQNLRSPEYSDNKGLAEDLTEGKFSFPVIHAVRADPADLRLLNILRQRTADDEVKRYAVAYMEAAGSFEYTRSVLEVLIARARRVADEIERVVAEGADPAGAGGDGGGAAARPRNKGIGAILDKMVIGGPGEMHFPAKKN